MPQVKEMLVSETPAYRAGYLGLGSLASWELLQLVCSFQFTETAQELLKSAGSLRALGRFNGPELQATSNVGPKAALAVQAALELGRRMAHETPAPQLQFRSPGDVVAACADLDQYDQEHFQVLLLDTKNRMIARKTVYIGTVNAINCRASEVVRDAVRANAPAIVLVHNHPSGDPIPSPEDVSFTKVVIEAGKLLDIEVLDHVIIGASGAFISLKEKGLAFG